MDRSLLNYAPVYRNWYRLAHAKDTPEKRLAFYDGILDYAFLGKVPPDPEEMDSPHGVDYARFDGYLTAQVSLDNILPKIIAGSIGGKKGGAAKGECKARRGAENGRYNQDLHNEEPSEDDAKHLRKAPSQSTDAKQMTQSTQSTDANKKEKEKEKENKNDNDVVSAGPTPAAAMDESVLLPSHEDQVLYCRQTGVPESYLPTFLGEIRALGFCYVNTSGNRVNINKTTFKPVLKKFYQVWARSKERSRKSAPPCDTLDESKVDLSQFGE